MEGEETMRRKSTKRCSLLILLLVAVFTLTACGNPVVGTWTNHLLGYETMLRFNNDGTFTISVLGILGASGRYTVSGNQIRISLADPTLSAYLPSDTSTFSVSGNQLIIDGIVYTK